MICDGLARLLLAHLADHARLRLVVDDLQRVAGVRNVVESGELHRRRRTGFLDALAALVGHRADAAGGRAGEERVADLQRAVLHEHRGHDAAADFLPRLEHDALRGRSRGSP